MTSMLTIKRYIMSVYRARTNCPVCHQDNEVWFERGVIVPLDLVECPKCEHLFEANNFVSSFIEMKNNISVSSNSLQYSVTI